MAALKKFFSQSEIHFTKISTVKKKILQLLQSFLNFSLMVSNKPKTNSGGSALKRLKKSLQSAGVVGQQAKASRSKKDRKKGRPTEKVDLDKKLSHIRGEFNPFETKVQRTKFEILGRKMKGTQGKPTLSKQVGEENVS
jgi:nucleolar protein 14